MHKRKWMIAIAVTLLAVFLSPLSGDRLSVVPEASAQDKVKWRGVAAHRVGAHYNLWRWLEKRLPEITDGEVSLETLTYGEIGIGGTEMLRIMRAGLIDIADVTSSYVAGDFPLIEATGPYAQALAAGRRRRC